MAAAKTIPLFEKEAQARQKAGTLASIEAKGKTTEKAADLLNVGRATVERSKKVLEGGSPELVTAVEYGNVAVSTAAEIATLPAEEQQETLKQGEAEILRKAKDIKRARAQRRMAERQARRTQALTKNHPLTGEHILRSLSTLPFNGMLHSGTCD